MTCITQANCASLGSALAINPKPQSTRIASPFPDYNPGSKSDPAQNMVLRTKKGDRTVELEIPGDIHTMGEFVLPLSPEFKDSLKSSSSGKGDRNSDSAGLVDDSYKNRAPSISDREFEHSRSQGLPADEQRRHDIEESLSLSPSEDNQPTASSSYLASMDHIKQLYRIARFEVALLETDEMIRQYPTDPTLHEMRGTLLDRLGRRDLALQAWNQSLRLDTKNASLRRFIERKNNASSKAGTP